MSLRNVRCLWGLVIGESKPKQTMLVIAANSRDASADFSIAISGKNKIFTPAKYRARRILHHQTEGICGLALIVCA